MTIRQLIAFKVKAIEPPVPEVLREQAGSMLESRLEILAKFARQKPDMWGKIWTVAGYQQEMFLLIRPGEISHWYPQEYCEVID